MHGKLFSCIFTVSFNILITFFSSAQRSSGTQPQLIVVLDRNYGLPRAHKTPAKKNKTETASVSSSTNVTCNKMKKAAVTQNISKQILNGSNSFHTVFSIPQKIATSR